MELARDGVVRVVPAVGVATGDVGGLHPGDLATERRERDVDARPVFGAPGRAGDCRHLVERVGKVVGEQPETRDARRPAPIARLQVDDVVVAGHQQHGTLQPSCNTRKNTDALACCSDVFRADKQSGSINSCTTRPLGEMVCGRFSES